MSQDQKFGSIGRVAYSLHSCVSFSRKASEVKLLEENPTRANWRGSRFDSAKLHSAGINFRLVKSPDAPKITITQGSGGWPLAGRFGFMFASSLRTCAQRGRRIDAAWRKESF